MAQNVELPLTEMRFYEVIMHCAKTLYAITVAGLLAFSSVVQATVYEFDYGKLLTPSNQSLPDNFALHPFAHLIAEDSNNGRTWTFTLSINNTLFSSFGNGAFIGSMGFDFAPGAKDPEMTLLGHNLPVTGNMVVVKTIDDIGGGYKGFDFGTKFGNGSNDRLSQNDWVKWRVSDLVPKSSLINTYIQVQGIDGGKSAKYTPLAPVTAVPEPESYAMILAGLVLIGFTSRRWKRNV